MKLLKNQGTERVIDELRTSLAAQGSLDAASPDLSLFAYGELREVLRHLSRSRLIAPLRQTNAQSILGSAADRGSRNQLSARKLASDLAEWVRNAVEVKGAPSPLPQATLVAKNADGTPVKVISGNCPLTTDGLGITPANQFSLVQATETLEESQLLAGWFTQMWNALPASADGKAILLSQLKEITAQREPYLIYLLTIYHLFKDRGNELDEDKIVKSATGIRETVVWKKLFKFQRDGVIGAIDKLERLGGCIIADSVGLGKTFEALAIIKYYELRNDRVLVLVPKRLRDNWTLYKTNDRRNVLAPDRLNYDVLNHTDLSRDGGKSGDIELSHVNWGNYDLVVIDESHNFRNKASLKDRETRYDRLMRRIIKDGVKTRSPSSPRARTPHYSTMASPASSPLIHRAIPYPVFLIQSQPGTLALSLAHLRWSQGQSGQTVLDGSPTTATLDTETPPTEAFLAALNVTGQPRQHLHTLYQGWMERFEAHAAARLTGSFTPAPDAVAAERRRAALAEHERLTREITSLRARAVKEPQLNRRVELNLQLKQLESRLAEAANHF